MRGAGAWLLPGALLLVGCEDSAGPELEPDAAIGFWSLATVDGNAPPYLLILAPGFRLDLMDDELLIAEDSTYVEVRSYRETISTTTGDSTSTYEDLVSGRWKRGSGSTITLTETGRPAETATVAKARLTLEFNGVVMVFEKQNQPMRATVRRMK